MFHQPPPDIGSMVQSRIIRLLFLTFLLAIYQISDLRRFHWSTRPLYQEGVSTIGNVICIKRVQSKPSRLITYSSSYHIKPFYCLNGPTRVYSFAKFFLILSLNLEPPANDFNKLATAKSLALRCLF